MQALPVYDYAPFQVPVVVSLGLPHFHLFDATLMPGVVVPTTEHSLGQSHVVPVDGYE